jgi:sulfate adenylyltransferase subunit 2
MEYKLQMVVGQNKAALAEKDTFPDKFKANPNMSAEEQAEARTACCGRLKTDALTATVHGTGPRMRLNLETGKYELMADKLPYTGVIAGARSDEEGSRSKERYFSPRGKHDDWDVGDQPPEFWNQFKTDFAPGSHIRIHPLLHWTELNVWEYIEREQIPVIPLYFDDGTGRRYRSLGCAPCTGSIASTARTVHEIIEELRATKVPERAGRAQDQESEDAFEKLRRDGYM